MEWKWIGVIAVSGMLLLPGCMQVDYIGQHYAPTEKVVYLGQEDIPAGYEIIGRAALNAPDNYTGEEIRDKLLDKAKAVGAEAVVIESARRVESGDYNISESNSGSLAPTGSWTRNSYNMNGSRNATNSWGQTGPVSNTNIKQYDMVVKAYFLRRENGKKDRKTELGPKP
ncbi:MAG: hypothetical protein PHQ27_00620 [Victivallales bacterium]|nr:hypothetical protein [Victivallales bacterium]